MRVPFLSHSPWSAAVDIGPTRVAAMAVSSRGGVPVVTAHAVEPLPGRAVVPGPNAVNIADQAVVAAALARAFERLGSRPRRVGLIIPDSVAKVSLLRFEKVPSRADDLDQLIRWQVRKTAPFRVEDAQVAYVAGAEAADGGREFIVTLARRDIIQEYEQVCTQAGAQAGVVDLATFNLINVALAATGTAAGDWLVVHVTPASSTLAIMRGEDLIFFRSRGANGEGSLTDLVHQTAMYYEDRLQGGGFSRVWLAGTGADAARIGRDLEQRLRRPVEAIDFRPAAALADRIAPSADLIDALAPMVGLALREHAA